MKRSFDIFNNHRNYEYYYFGNAPLITNERNEDAIIPKKIKRDFTKYDLIACVNNQLTSSYARAFDTIPNIQNDPIMKIHQYFAILKSGKVYTIVNIKSIYRTENIFYEVPNVHHSSEIRFPELFHVNIIDIKSTTGLHECYFFLSSRGDVDSIGSGDALGLNHKNIELNPKRLTFKFNNEIVRIKQISAGKNHCVALSRTGHVYTWGRNGERQLGKSSKNKYLTPRRMQYFDDKRITNIYCTDDTSYAIDKFFKVYIWGYKNHIHYNRLLPENLPLQLPLQIKEVAALNLYPVFGGIFTMTPTRKFYYEGRSLNKQYGYEFPYRIKAFDKKQIIDIREVNTDNLGEYYGVLITCKKENSKSLRIQLMRKDFLDIRLVIKKDFFI